MFVTIYMNLPIYEARFLIYKRLILAIFENKKKPLFKKRLRIIIFLL